MLGILAATEDSMNRMAVLAVAALALACGGSDGGSADLNPAFSGTWWGPSTIAAAGYQPYTYQSSMVVAVSGHTATVANICPTGSASLTTSGSGNEASWTGNLVCPAVSFGGCYALTLTIQTGSARLNSNGTITVQGTGTATGCGNNMNVTYTFIGSR